MLKEEIIAKVKYLNLPKGSYVVFGSAPMALAGIREANDIDLLVSKEVFEQLKKHGWQEKDKGANDKPLEYDIFEAHQNWDFSSYNPTLSDLLARATEVEGVPIASIEDVRKWKEASGRPKDLADLKLIGDYRKNNIKHLWFDFSDTLALTNKEEYYKILYSTYANIVGKEVTSELKKEYDNLFEKYKSNSAVFVSLGRPSSFLADCLGSVDPKTLYQLTDKEIPSILKELKDIVSISIFSNNNVRKLLPALGIDPAYFTYILGPTSVKKPKPALDGFYQMIDLSKSVPGEILFIGDDVAKDLLPAKELGILTGLLWKTSSEADYCFEDFGEILGLFQEGRKI